MSRVAVAVFAMLALSLSGVSLAAAAPPYAADYPLAAGAGSQQAPDLALGGWGWPAVSEDDSSGSWRALASWGGQTLTVATAAGGQRHPAVFQNRLVYEDDRNGKPDMYVPGSPFRATPCLPRRTSPRHRAGRSARSGDRRGHGGLRERSRGSSRHLRAVDLHGLERRLTSNAADQVDPAVEGTSSSSPTTATGTGTSTASISGPARRPASRPTDRPSRRPRSATAWWSTRTTATGTGTCTPSRSRPAGNAE